MIFLVLYAISASTRDKVDQMMVIEWYRGGVCDPCNCQIGRMAPREESRSYVPTRKMTMEGWILDKQGGRGSY